MTNKRLLITNQLNNLSIPLSDLISIAFKLKHQTYEIYKGYEGKKNLSLHYDPDSAIFYISYLEGISRITTMIKPDMNIVYMEKLISSFIVYDMYKLGMSVHKITEFLDLPLEQVRKFIRETNKLLNQITLDEKYQNDLREITKIFKYHISNIIGIEEKNILTKDIISIILSTRLTYYSVPCWAETHKGTVGDVDDIEYLR